MASQALGPRPGGTGRRGDAPAGTAGRADLDRME